MDIKTCSKCGISKPIEEFSRKAAAKDGRRSSCKVCAAKWREANIQSIKQQRKEFRQQNKEPIHQRNQRYYAANRDAILLHEKNRRLIYNLELNSRARVRRQEQNGNGRWRNSPQSWATRKWIALNQRTINGNNQVKRGRQLAYLNKGIKLEMTLDQFKEFVERNWQLIQSFYDAKEVPSIDRINPDKHYSLDNIRIISLVENIKLARRGKRSL